MPSPFGLGAVACIAFTAGSTPWATATSLEGRFLAAVKACGPGAVLSHFSAAALYELVRWDDRHPEITAPTTRTHSGIRAHRSSMLEVQDTTHHTKASRQPRRREPSSTSRPRSSRGPSAASSARRRPTSPPSARSSGRSTASAPPRHHQLTRILATGPAPTRSELEDTVLDLPSMPASRTPMPRFPARGEDLGARVHQPIPAVLERPRIAPGRFPEPQPLTRHHAAPISLAQPFGRELPILSRLPCLDCWTGRATYYRTGLCE